MTEKINVLQIGQTDWTSELATNDKFSRVNWHYLKNDKFDTEVIEKMHKKIRNTYDVTLITDEISDEQFSEISDLTEAYTVLLDEKLQNSKNMQLLNDTKCPIFFNFSDKDKLLDTIINDFFSGQEGTKLRTADIITNKNFNGSVTLNGQAYITFDGDFDLLKNEQLMNWQYNILMDGKNRRLNLEYYHDDGVKISMSVLKLVRGTDIPTEIVHYDETQIEQGIDIEDDGSFGYISVAIHATGTGKLSIGPLHYRRTRHEYGEFFAGGQKVVDAKKQELLYYFNPGDLQPPLNVYFSGYRSAEGFEGFYMMKNKNAPFLLIADPRLEGGSFYLGSEELEDSITKVIQDSLDKLGFSNHDLILSGLSMGTFGALFYASKLEPRYVIIGKPLASIGDIAENETIKRPDVFPTSLDVLKSLEGSLSKTNRQKLNNRFWKQFQLSEYSYTDFIVAYMENDDYDPTGYSKLLDTLSDTDTTIIGKGILGRHNDNTSAILQWFDSQYNRVLDETFHRGKD